MSRISVEIKNTLDGYDKDKNIFKKIVSVLKFEKSLDNPEIIALRKLYNEIPANGNLTKSQWVKLFVILRDGGNDASAVSYRNISSLKEIVFGKNWDAELMKEIRYLQALASAYIQLSQSNLFTKENCAKIVGSKRYPLEVLTEILPSLGSDSNSRSSSESSSTVTDNADSSSTEATDYGPPIPREEYDFSECDLNSQENSSEEGLTSFSSTVTSSAKFRQFPTIIIIGDSEEDQSSTYQSSENRSSKDKSSKDKSSEGESSTKPNSKK